jgi:hypothetical protein
MAHPGSRTQLSMSQQTYHGGSANYRRAEADTLVTIDTFAATSTLSSDLTLTDGDILLTSSTSTHTIRNEGGVGVGLQVESTNGFLNLSSGAATNTSTQITSAGGITLVPNADGVRITQNDLHILAGNINLTDTGAREIRHTGAAGAGLTVRSSNGPLQLHAGDAGNSAIHLEANAGGVTIDSAKQITVNTDTGVEEVTITGRVSTNNMLASNPVNPAQLQNANYFLTGDELLVGFAQEDEAIQQGRAIRTPDAVDIVAALTNPRPGTKFIFTVDNHGGGVHSRTLVAGVGVTTQGSTNIQGGQVVSYHVVCLNVTPGSEHVRFSRMD